MNPSPTQSTISTTFVVRFWHEQARAEPRWRGRIEHVQHGQRADFMRMEDMLSFLHQWGVTVAHFTNSKVLEMPSTPTHPCPQEE